DAGITLAQWFFQEGERIATLLAGDEHERERKRLVAAIRAHAGTVTVRTLMRLSRRHRTAKIAENALEALVEDGLGQWITLPTRERGKTGQRAFRLLDSTSGEAADEPACPASTEPIADVPLPPVKSDVATETVSASGRGQAVDDVSAST